MKSYMVNIWIEPTPYYHLNSIKYSMIFRVKISWFMIVCRNKKLMSKTNLSLIRHQANRWSRKQKLNNKTVENQFEKVYQNNRLLFNQKNKTKILKAAWPNQTINNNLNPRFRNNKLKRLKSSNLNLLCKLRNSKLDKCTKMGFSRLV